MVRQPLFKSITNASATLTEPIIESILERIRDGKLWQGDNCPPGCFGRTTQRHRTSLYEALKELIYRGVVHCVHGRGTFVSERFTLSREIAEARKIIEPGAAALAARNLFPEDLLMNSRAL